MFVFYFSPKCGQIEWDLVYNHKMFVLKFKRYNEVAILLQLDGKIRKDIKRAQNIENIIKKKTVHRG